MKPRIAVVGGGWAGCAAALVLAEAGVNVTLFEAGRVLGGRARGVTLDGRPLDNGQHILLGAYSTCLDLMRRARVPESSLWRLGLRIDAPPTFRLTCPPLPSPLNLLAGFAATRGLHWRDKWNSVRWARRLLAVDAPEACTVSALTHGQPEAARRMLWHPLCVSALNTPPDIADAQTFIAVLRAAFGARRNASDFLLPRRDLTTLFPAAAATRITQLGGEVHTRARITRIDAGSDALTLHTPTHQQAFSHAVIAVAPQHLDGLTAAIPEFDAIRRMTATYAYQPIATAYVQYDPAFRLARPLFALTDGPAQFVFDRGQSHGQSGMLAFVASTAASLADDWLDQAKAQLRRIAHPGSARWQRSIVEKQATYACIPGLPRPPVRTPHPRLYLAGDYTAGDYPATLESAASSGVQSAHALLDTL